MIYFIDTPREIALERMQIRIAENTAAGRAIRQDDQLKVLNRRIDYAQELTMPAMEWLIDHGIPMRTLDGATDIKRSADLMDRRVSEMQNFANAVRRSR